ncbi:IS66 family insertion sequence element accessory protein TnpB [Paraburkholderia sp. RCC_158]|uniref:IS66 family insertion sequence element accessory protein TnpB n=1 Tax=Paraburkholderia sp. RCC_158 TaxID=3239220 RepID=UPI003526A038
MFRLDERLNVYLHRGPVDFRYGMNSLSILVEQSMQLNPMIPLFTSSGTGVVTESRFSSRMVAVSG